MRSFLHPLSALAGAGLALLASTPARAASPLQDFPPRDPSATTVPTAERAPAPVATAGDARRALQPIPSTLDAAQPGAPATIDALRLRDRERALDLQRDESGALWVRGRTYKARFDARSATYVPDFGPRAPRSFPVTFTVAAARLGGVELDVTSRGEARAVAGGVEMERAAFVERYELRRDSIEQTFVLGERAADGDLVIDVDVESELELGDDASGSLALRGEHGAVLYGRASVVDARGVRTDVATRRGSGRITIEVADAVLDASVFPLVVDPIVSTFDVDVTAYDDFAPDAAYDATNARWLVVMEEAFSATDHDVFSYLLDAAGGLVTAAYAEIGAEDWRRPAVANLNAADQFLVVAEAGNVPGAAFRVIRARAASAAPVGVTVYPSPSFTVSGPTTSDCQEPDVGGDSYPSSPSYYCVTWNRAITAGNHDVQYRLVDWLSAPIGAVPATIDANANNDTQTAISAGAGDPFGVDQRFTIVWRRESTYDQIRAAQISWNGGLIASHVVHAGTMSDPFDLTSPAVSTISTGPGTAQLYAVTFEYAPGSIFDDIQYVLFDGTAQSSELYTAYHVAGLTASKPQIEWDGVTFTLLHRGHLAATPNVERLYVRTIGLTSNAGFAAEPFAYSLWVPYSTESIGTSTPSLQARMFLEPAAAGAQRRALVVWDEQAAPGAQSDVVAALREHQPYGFPLTYCWGEVATCPCGDGPHAGQNEVITGCANSVNPEGGMLSPAGSFQVSADTARLSAQQVPPSAACLFLQGTATVNGGPGSLFGDGLRCVGGSVIRLGTKTASGGFARYGEAGDVPISVRGMVPATGATRFYQVWYRNAAAFCTASTFNLTNGIILVWFP